MVKLKIRSKEVTTTARRRRTPQKAVNPMTFRFDFRAFLRSAVILLFMAIFLGGIFVIPYISTVNLRFFIFAVLGTFVVFYFLYLLYKNGFILIPWPYEFVLLGGFVLYLILRTCFSLVGKYTFWDQFMITMPQFELFVIAIGLIFTFGLVATYLQNTSRRAIFSLPCIVFTFDVLGFIFSRFSGLVRGLFASISENIGVATAQYFKRMGIFGFFSDVNLWFLFHIISLALLAYLLVKYIKDSDQEHTLKVSYLAVISIILLWLTTLYLGGFSLPVVVALVILAYVIYIVAKEGLGMRGAIIFSVGFWGLFVVFNVLQVVFGLKKLVGLSSLLESLDILRYLKSWEAVLGLKSVYPKVVPDTTLAALFGTGFGLFGVLGKAAVGSYPNFIDAGVIKLLVELGLIGLMFWIFQVWIFAKEAVKAVSLRKKLVFWLVVLTLVWTALVPSNAWAILWVFMFMLWTSAAFGEQAQINLVSKQFNLARWFAPLGAVALFVATTGWSVLAFSGLRDLYAVGLRKRRIASLPTKEAFNVGREALNYVTRFSDVCGRCRYSKVLQLGLLDTLDDLVSKDKEFAKKIDKALVEQLGYGLVAVSEDVASEYLVEDANKLSAKVYAKLSSRNRLKTFTSLAIYKYSDCLKLNPLDYKTAITYVNFLLGLDSKKGDDVYNRLETLLDYLATLARGNPNLTFNVALLRSRFYIKYRQYDEALKIYDAFIDQIEKSKGLSKKDKQTWIDTLKKVKQKVEELKQKSSKSTANKKQKAQAQPANNK